MRLLFACQECSTHYLPPENLTYGDGTEASPVWCSACQAAMADRGITESPMARAVALAAARADRDTFLASRERAAAVDVRPSRPARTGRRGRPSGARSKLS
ncbi:hypothetical protein [Kitasatospora sp. NPDC004289]